MENTQTAHKFETLPTLPDFLSELLSSKLTSLDLKTLLLNHMPKIDGTIEINDPSTFIQEISNNFDYFHVKKLSEEIDIFKKYDESIRIDDLKTQSNTRIQEISNSFNAIEQQFENNNKKELDKIKASIANLTKNSQKIDDEKTLKTLNDDIKNIRKNIRIVSEGKTETGKKTLEEFLIKIENLEDTINKKAIAQQCIKNNIDLLSIYLGKNYNRQDITNFLTDKTPKDLLNKENQIIVQGSNIEKFMDSFYEFQKTNSFISPQVIDYIVDQNDPLKEIKESLFSKFSFLSLTSNKKPLEINAIGKNAVIEGAHNFFRDPENLDYLIKNHGDITKFSIEMLFGLDGDIITRLANFITDDLLIPQEKKGLWNGGIKGWIRNQFGIDENLIGAQEEKLLFIKNIQTLKVLIYFQLYNIHQNKKEISKDEVRNLFQSFIDIWEKSLTSTMFKLYKTIEESMMLRNLHNISGWIPNFIAGEDVKENLLLIKKLQEDSINSEKKKLKEYYDQLKIEIGNNDEKKALIETRYNQEIVNLDNKLKLIQDNPTDQKNIKNFFGQLTTTLFGDSPSFELTIKLSKIEKADSIKTAENIKIELENFFTEIKTRKEQEKENYIKFVKEIGGEFFFKKEIKEEIKTYLIRVNNTRDKDTEFLENLQKNFLLNNLVKEKISGALVNDRANVEKINGLIFNLFQDFGSNTSPSIFNIKDKIISLREEIKKIDKSKDQFEKYNIAFTNKEEYLANLSKELEIDLKNQTIISSINENLSNAINEISKFKNLHKQTIAINKEGTILSINATKTNNATSIITMKPIKHHITNEPQKSKHGYIYSGIGGSIITCGALAITGIFMKKDMSMENKVFASLVITAIVLTILIACVLSYKYELPNKAFNFCSSYKNKNVDEKTPNPL